MDDSFENISVLFEIGQYVYMMKVIGDLLMSSRVLMPDIRKLREAIKPSRTYKGDGM